MPALSSTTKLPQAERTTLSMALARRILFAEKACLGTAGAYDSWPCECLGGRRTRPPPKGCFGRTGRGGFSLQTGQLRAER